MPASQEHIGPGTPMGATLLPDGVTMRLWAPAAERVYVAFDEKEVVGDDQALTGDGHGLWSGFFPGVRAGRKYRFYVVGTGRSGFKRDPYAKELELYGYPDCDGIVVDDDAYPWHDQHWQPPAPSDLIVYQFHVGVFSAVDEAGRDFRPHRTAKLLDAAQRLPYLADLGATAVQPLAGTVFQGEWSLGYNGTDLFSPEMDYCVGPAALPGYLDRINALLVRAGADPLKQDQLAGQANQLKAFVDLCHLHGLAVIFDVVYNHSGGGFDSQSIDWIDLSEQGGGENAYFSGDSWAGGRVFAFGRPQVARYLTDNALLFLEGYHADGLRFDEVSVITRFGGRRFCQDVTTELHARKPAYLVAEYWPDDGRRYEATLPVPDGLGFDFGYADILRDGVRGVLAAASAGGCGPIGLGRLVDGLYRPWGVAPAWRAYNCLENHDLVLDLDTHRAPRIATLAGGGDPRSWYARSRSRFATALLLTAPGTPMIFMGEEFLEDKLWSDSPGRTDRLIWWDGALGADQSMIDFLRFTRDAIALRRELPALRSDPITVFSVDEANRVVAFHRWVPGGGADVVVVGSLNETTLHGYDLGLPVHGTWRERFNSDYYDHFPNPWVEGNGGSVVAAGRPLHGFDQSATLTVPANGVLVLSV